jgi:monoamine oxidase
MPEDVAVIGAGAAGLTAAIDLARAGFRVTIVEARDRIGGRMYTRIDPTLNAAVELGAEFVHGKPAEIWDLIRAHRLEAREVDGDQWCFRNNRLCPCTFFSEIEGVLGYMDDRAPDECFTDFLSRCCPHASQEAKAWALGFVQGFHAANPELVSVHSLVKSNRAEDKIEGDRAFRITGGYATLLNIFAGEIRDLGIALHLKTAVDEISWRRGQVNLTLHDQSATRTVSAARVVVSLPLGVLQARSGETGAVQFVPALPAEKLAALQNLEMGKVIRVTLCFRERFWADLHPPNGSQPKSLANLSFLLSRDEWFPTWWTWMPEELPIIVAWAPFPSADRLSGKAEGFAVDKSLETLSRLLKVDKSQIAAQLASAYTHDWQSDPWSRGAYSYVKVGGDNAERDLGLPVEDTLFFAGEATDDTGNNGTVNGALASGKRVAREIIAASK